MTKIQLLDIAGQLGVEGLSGRERKADMIAAILEVEA